MRILLALLLATALAPAGAVDPFIENKAEGWFWYRDPPEPPPEPEIELPPPMPVIMAPEALGPEPLSVEWFNQTYPVILNTAIDDPTPENVSNYRYATRVMLDKASNFAHEFKRQALLDPLLDESNRYPFSQASRGSYQRFTREQKEKAVELMTDQAGLWVFVDDECPFCALQYPITKRTAQERGFIVTYITPDGEPPVWMDVDEDVRQDVGQSAVLEISVRPATALVIPPDDITVLTQGMLSQDLLEERILYAGDAAGLLTQAERKHVFPMEAGLLTPEEIREAGESMRAYPDQITPTIQSYLRDPPAAPPTKAPLPPR